MKEMIFFCALEANAGRQRRHEWLHGEMVAIGRPRRSVDVSASVAANGWMMDFYGSVVWANVSGVSYVESGVCGDHRHHACACPCAFHSFGLERETDQCQTAAS